MIPPELYAKAKLLFEYETAEGLMEDDEHQSFAPDRVVQFLTEQQGYNESYIPEKVRMKIRLDLLTSLDKLDEQRFLPKK